MILGFAKIRRWCRENSKWTDKTAKKHKHNFCIPVIVELQKPKGSVFYKAMRCDSCYSFVDAECIKEPAKAVIILKSSHTAIGFKDASRLT